MASEIKLNENGTYSIRVYARHKDEYGKRRTKYKSGIKSIATAKMLAKEFEEELERYVDGDIDIAEANKLYLESRKGKVQPTTYNGFATISKPILEQLGRVSIKDINTRVVQQYVDKRQKEQNKNTGGVIRVATVQREVRYIKTLINWLVTNDYLDYNRIKRIEYIPDEEEFEPTTLTIEQVAEVLTDLKENYYNLFIPVLISITTSARRGEALGLRWSQVDFELGTINFSNNLVQVDTKVISKSTLKTKSSKRIVGMSDFLSEELQQHKNLCVGIDSDYVCANPFDGEVPISPSNLTHKFHKYMLERFGVTMRLHDLRHSFNQLAFEGGVDLSTRSKIMGHSNEKLTNRVYTHNSITQSKKATNIIGDAIKNKIKNCEQDCDQ